MGIKICSFASGSKGNCFLIENDDTHVLIDVGITLSSIVGFLAEKNLTINDLSGVLITHDHIDHIRSIGPISKKLPVYMNFSAYKAMSAPPSKVKLFSNDPFTIGNLEITAFSVPHDAPYTVGFCIKSSEDQLTYATDMGEMTKDYLTAAKGASTVVIESNHDVELLKNGRYPFYLKKRILSKYGHLSNEECAKTILELAENGTKRFILSHLSEENNLPELAYWTAAETLSKAGANLNSEISLNIALQRELITFN